MLRSEIDSIITLYELEKERQMTKILAKLLVIILAVSFIPINVFAEEPAVDPTQEIDGTEQTETQVDPTAETNETGETEATDEMQATDGSEQTDPTDLTEPTEEIIEKPNELGLPWWLSSKATTVSPLRMPSGDVLNIKSVIKEPVKGYSVIQGLCTDGTYAYVVMWKKRAKTARIVKIDLADNTMVKVSGKLSIDHGNALTWDSAHKRIVVTNNTGHRKRVTFVNPNSLKVTGYKNISIPKKLKGASKKKLRRIKGFASVSYNPAKNQYIAVISKYHDFLILNSKFKPIKYETVKKYGLTYQSGDVYENYFILALATGKNPQKNRLIVYNWNGKYKAKITLPGKYEIQGLFHVGKEFYAGYYHEKSIKGGGQGGYLQQILK